MKVVTIVENHPILGVKYGVANAPENTPTIRDAQKCARQYQAMRNVRNAKLRRENTKHK